MENAAQADICVLVSYLLSAPRSPRQGPTSLTAAAQSGAFVVVLSVSVAHDGEGSVDLENRVQQVDILHRFIEALVCSC